MSAETRTDTHARTDDKVGEGERWYGHRGIEESLTERKGQLNRLAIISV